MDEEPGQGGGGAGPLGYRARAEDRREWGTERVRVFKQQVWAGARVGLMGIVLWVAANVWTRGAWFTAVNALVGSAVLAGAGWSVAKHRTGGFVMGLVMAAAAAALIAGCGVAAIFSGVF